MAEKKPLSPKAKKYLIYGGLGLAGALAVYVSTLQTEKAPAIREPEQISLTGNVDTRSVSLEGLSRRLADLEAGRETSSKVQNDNLARITEQVGTLTSLVERMQDDNETRMNKLIEDALGQQSAAPAAVGEETDSDPATQQVDATNRRIRQLTEQIEAQNERRRLEAAEAARFAERERQERDRRESIYRQPDPVQQQQAASQPAMPAPRIAVYQSEDKPAPEQEAQPEPHSNVPDLNIPAGSILTAHAADGPRCAHGCAGAIPARAGSDADQEGSHHAQLRMGGCQGMPPSRICLWRAVLRTCEHSRRSGQLHPRG